MHTLVHSWIFDRKPIYTEFRKFNISLINSKRGDLNQVFVKTSIGTLFFAIIVFFIFELFFMLYCSNV